MTFIEARRAIYIDFECLKGRPPDTHGYCDRAVGWFAGSATDLEQVGCCVKSYWHSQKAFGQERWAYLFDEGAFDDAAANALAHAVWSVEEGSDDD